MTARPLSLYIHIPFCKRRCPYCTFYHVSGPGDRERVFVAALTAELDAAKEAIGPFEARTLFLGGGTPSVLGSHALRAIFGAVESFISPHDDPEFTVEVNPEDVTRELLVLFREHRVNRISVGLESMDARALRVLGRCTPAMNRRTLDTVSSVFGNFSVDVLLGIPGVRDGHVASTLEVIGAARPPHVSVYCLEPGGALEEQVAPFLAQVDPEQSADEYLAVCDALADFGYEHYEVSNFARPGFESRHNRAYWTGDEYLGLGPGAHSFIDGVRYHNVPDIDRYIDTLGGTTGEIREVEDRGPEQIHLEKVMLGLRTSAGVASNELRCPPSLIDELVAAGLAHAGAGRVFLTDRGYLVLNEVVDRMTRPRTT